MLTGTRCFVVAEEVGIFGVQEFIPRVVSEVSLFVLEFLFFHLSCIWVPWLMYKYVQ